jgi:hypothetical protein
MTHLLNTIGHGAKSRTRGIMLSALQPSLAMKTLSSPGQVPGIKGKASTNDLNIHLTSGPGSSFASCDNDLIPPSKDRWYLTGL